MSTKFIENQVKRVESMKRPLQVKLSKLDENFKRIATSYKQKRDVIVSQLTALDSAKDAFSKPVQIDIESSQSGTVSNATQPLTPENANEFSGASTNEITEEQVVAERTNTADKVQAVVEDDSALFGEAREWK